MHTWLLLIVLLGLTLAPFTHAWGPLTHQKQGIMLDNSSFFVMGASAPDAFAHLASGDLHSFSFAGYQLVYALQQQFSDEIMDFAKGFAAHMAMDLVAHSPHGYPTCKVGPDLMELQIDTYEFEVNDTRPVFFVDPSHPEISEFISNATIFWTKASGKGHNYTLGDIKEWEVLFDGGLEAEAKGIPYNKDYQQHMIDWDPYGASSFNETLSHLLKNLQCSQLSAETYIAALVNGTSPDIAEANVRSAVKAWYLAGDCTP